MSFFYRYIIGERFVLLFSFKVSEGFEINFKVFVLVVKEDFVEG